MIVIGSDPHKRSYTFSAVVAETGELRGSETVAVSSAGHQRMLDWARALDVQRVWAVEDCRHVSAKLERFLLARGERVVRVPPQLMAGRRAARARRARAIRSTRWRSPERRWRRASTRCRSRRLRVRRVR